MILKTILCFLEVSEVLQEQYIALYKLVVGNRCWWCQCSILTGYHQNWTNGFETEPREQVFRWKVPCVALMLVQNCVFLWWKQFARKVAKYVWNIATHSWKMMREECFREGGVYNTVCWSSWWRTLGDARFGQRPTKRQTSLTGIPGILHHRGTLSNQGSTPLLTCSVRGVLRV